MRRRGEGVGVDEIDDLGRQLQLKMRAQRPGVRVVEDTSKRLWRQHAAYRQRRATHGPRAKDEIVMRVSRVFNQRAGRWAPALRPKQHKAAGAHSYLDGEVGFEDRPSSARKLPVVVPRRGDHIPAERRHGDREPPGADPRLGGAEGVACLEDAGNYLLGLLVVSEGGAPELEGRVVVERLDGAT